MTQPTTTAMTMQLASYERDDLARVVQSAAEAMLEVDEAEDGSGRILDARLVGVPPAALDAIIDEAARIFARRARNSLDTSAKRR